MMQWFQADRYCSKMYLLVALVASSLCQVTLGEEVFDIEPNGQDVSQGRRAILLCTLKKEFSQLYDIKWLVDEKEIRDSERYHISEGQLTVQDIDRELDSGKFQCLARSKTGPTVEHRSKSVSLNIKWLEVGAVLLHSPKDARNILPGGRVILRCNITGNPKPRSKDIKWFRDGKPVPETMAELVRDRLIIASASLDTYDGVYSCCAEMNMKQQCSSPYRLHVRDISVPLLVTPPKNVIVQPGGDATFHCSFDAKPAPVIEWLNHDKELLTNKSRPGEDCRVCVYPNGTLIIRRVKTKLEGKYTCEATGSKGNVTSGSAEMIIAYIKPFSEPQTEEEYLKLGTNIEKVCSVPEALPPANVTWIKNGVKIAVSDGISSPRVTVSGNTLVITSARTSDKGDYQCMASNMAGNVTKTFRFLIAFAPKMRSELVARTEDEGDDVVLICNVDASPPITYTWYQGSSVISTSDHFHTAGNRLTIKSIAMEDAGTYKCLAKNPQGEASSSARIGVTEQLKLDPEPANTCIEIGERTEIVCAAKGTDNPSIEWSADADDESVGSEKHYEIITNSPGNKSLVFANPKAGDGGMFVCTARASDEDNAQSKTSIITVTVGKRPKISMKQPQNPTVFEGTAIRLDCGISNIENPSKIQWVVHANNTRKVYKLGMFSAGDAYTVMTNGSLYIKSAHITDSGEYTCSYEECGGKVQHNTTLFVTEGEGPITTPIGQDPDNDRDETPEYKKIQTVALAVGCSVAYLILTIAIIIYCRRKKRHRKPKNNNLNVEEESNNSDDREKLMMNGSTQQGNGHSKNNGICMTPVTHLDPDIEKLQYDASKLEKVTVIGQGEFGEVFLSKAPGLFPDLDDDILVMVKHFEPEKEKNFSSNNANGQISDSSITEPSNKTSRRFEFNREIRLLHLADHENIVKLLGVCSKDTTSPTSPDHLITEYLEWGILKLCLQASKKGKVNKFSKHLKMRMCCQIAAGLDHLTKLGLAHQDVATRNCVLSSKMVIKLTVLSLTKEGFENEYCLHNGKSVPVRWMAPEALEDQYELKSDVWSFGVTCWEIFMLGTMPYSDLSDSKFLEDFKSDHPPTLPPLENSKRITSLISKCCQLSTASRPEFYQIVKKLQSILGLESKDAKSAPQCVTNEVTSPNEEDVDATGPLLATAPVDPADSDKVIEV